MLKFELVTLSGVKFSEEVHEVVIPTPDGYIGVFENHAPLVSLVVDGVISIRRKASDKDDKLELFAVHGGVVEILEKEKKVRVLADEADLADDISHQEAAKALEAAKELRAQATDSVSLQHAQSLVDRQATRLKVAELRRRKRY